ncbi:MAG: hypothetical protein OJF50_005052 [Nitrospira sp.]|nr:hypothetical protein [Nitrospira sp.]
MSVTYTHDDIRVFNAESNAPLHMPTRSQGKRGGTIQL